MFGAGICSNVWCTSPYGKNVTPSPQIQTRADRTSLKKKAPRDCLLLKSGCDEPERSVTQILPSCLLFLNQFFTAKTPTLNPCVAVQLWVHIFKFDYSLWYHSPTSAITHTHSTECPARSWTHVSHLEWGSIWAASLHCRSTAPDFPWYIVFIATSSCYPWRGWGQQLKCNLWSSLRVPKVSVFAADRLRLERRIPTETSLLNN